MYLLSTVHLLNLAVFWLYDILGKKTAPFPLFPLDKNFEAIISHVTPILLPFT